MTEVKFGDLFAGGGGTTTGALSVPGLKVVWALNHSSEAITYYLEQIEIAKKTILDLQKD